MFYIEPICCWFTFFLV